MFSGRCLRARVIPLINMFFGFFGQVFTSEHQTGIPGLQHHVHRLSHMRKKEAAESVIRLLARFVSQIEHYLQDEGTKVRQGSRERGGRRCRTKVASGSEG